MVLSAPGYAMAIMAVVVITLQCLTLYDPTDFMKTYAISSEPAAKLIAFLLIVVNIYDIIAALQDNWIIYYYSAISRVVATGLFYSLGPEFHQLAGTEAATLVVLLGERSRGLGDQLGRDLGKGDLQTDKVFVESLHRGKTGEGKDTTATYGGVHQ